MFNRFIKAMDYLAYCKSAQQLRQMGYNDIADDIIKTKHRIYGR